MASSEKTLSEEVEEQTALAETQAVAQRLASQLSREKARTEILVAAVEQAARDAIVLAGRARIKAPAKDKRTKSPEVALVHATDWQAGKRTESFDLDVLHQRIMMLAAKVSRIADVQRADHPVRECVLVLGGDMVEGVDIFPGQAHEIDATLYEQFFRCGRTIEELITILLSAFEHVTVYDMFGNHGRLGRKGDYPRTDNIDRMLYRVVRDRFDDPRLEWHHANTWHQIIEVGNYRALLVHGDQIKSFGGNLPAYGILRKVNAWAAGVLDEFTDCYVGHFHTPQVLNAADGRSVYMTGSPESGNEFAREFVAATGEPTQTLNFIDPEAGRVSAHYRVHLS